MNSFPDISYLYFQADENWIKAIHSLEHLSNGDWIVPTQLTIFCFRELQEMTPDSPMERAVSGQQA